MAFQVALVSDAILQGQRTYHDATTVIATNLTNLNTIFAGGNYDLPGNFQLLMSGTNGEIREALSAYAGRRVACRSRHLGAYMCRDGSTYLVAIRGLAAERNPLHSRCLMRKCLKHLILTPSIRLATLFKYWKRRITTCPGNSLPMTAGKSHSSLVLA